MIIDYYKFDQRKIFFAFTMNKTESNRRKISFENHGRISRKILFI